LDQPAANVAILHCAVGHVDGKPAGKRIGMFSYSRRLGSWSYGLATYNGAATVLHGNLIKPGKMRCATEKRQTGGKIRKLPIGSKSAGKTWATDYDLTWVLKNLAPRTAIAA
jgi:hypothetical protein